MRAVDIPKRFKTVACSPGPAPMLQWIGIDKLVIDDGYQRELKGGNWTAIQRIALGFTWSRFSPVFVAPVEGGRYAIIDGQHRTHAAALCGLSEVPCQIVQMDRTEQAASFAAVNGLVTKVTIWNIYKAALVAGESWAVACRDTCADAGCTLMERNNTTEEKKPGEVYAIGLVRGFVRDGHRAAVTAVLSGLRGSAFGETADAYTNQILRPLFDAVSTRPRLLHPPRDLSGFMDDFDIYAAIDAADETAKRRRRAGFAGVTRYDLAAAAIGDALDERFPATALIAAPGAGRNGVRGDG